MVRREVGFAGLRLNCRLRDEPPNRNAFTSLAAARPIVQARDYNLARGIKLSVKTHSVYSIHNRWLRLLRAAVINWMLVLHVSMSVEPRFPRWLPVVSIHPPRPNHLASLLLSFKKGFFRIVPVF
jgi:hypothetical protein